MRFAKAAEHNFSSEIFRIVKVIHRRPRVLYELGDLNGTPIDCQFYSRELSPVRITIWTIYEIDKIMDKRVRRGIREVLVRWQGCGHDFDSWIPVASVKLSNMTSSNSFYLTLFSNALREIYENNTHADFTVKLSRPIDGRNSPNWEVGVCEVSCSSPQSLNTVDDTPCADHALLYCNIISPQFVGDSTVRCMRRFPTTSCQNYEFRNVQYVPVEHRQFQSIGIEFLTLERLHVPFEDSITPTKVVLYFLKKYKS
jgi:hypothetical protein